MGPEEAAAAAAVAGPAARRSACIRPGATRRPGRQSPRTCYTCTRCVCWGGEGVVNTSPNQTEPNANERGGECDLRFDN